MTDEEKLQRILARVSSLNAEAVKIQDSGERRRFLFEGMQQIHSDLELVLGRYLAETKRQELRSVPPDINTIDILLLLAKQELTAASQVLQALIDKITKQEK